MANRAAMLFVDRAKDGFAVFRRGVKHGPIIRRVSAIYKRPWDAQHVRTWLHERDLGYPKPHGQRDGDTVD